MRIESAPNPNERTITVTSEELALIVDLLHERSRVNQCGIEYVEHRIDDFAENLKAVGRHRRENAVIETLQKRLGLDVHGSIKANLGEAPKHSFDREYLTALREALIQLDIGGSDPDADPAGD